MKIITAGITAVSSWVPEEKLTNADIAKMVDTTDAWIIERCGISERRILRDPGKATSYLAIQAVGKLLCSKYIDPKSIDLLILATATPDHQFPATANYIAHAVGATNAWSFDVMGACSGFIYALNVGRQFIETGTHKRVVVVGADKMSSVVDYTDRSSCILFGDAAGAVLLEPVTNDTGILDAQMYSDGSARDLLYMKAGGSAFPASEASVANNEHFISMQGRAVFKVAVEKMADAAESIMKSNNLSSDDIKFLVPHQANKRIIDATAARMGVGPEKVMLNIHKYGNTTCATIPLCLSEWESQLRKDDNLILTAFGAGFTWGAIYVKWAYDKIETQNETEQTNKASVKHALESV